MNDVLKSLIDSVIMDLSENKSVEGILLKTQTISYYLKDEDFSSWIRHEQNGYGDDDFALPDYRKVNCVVKIDISQPFGCMVKNYPYPCEYIKDEKILDRLTHMPVYEALSEIEMMKDNYSAGNDLTMAVPQFIVQNYMAKNVEGNILIANQHINMNNIQAVVSKFKSKLLSFFLELNERMDWNLNFDAMATKEIIKKIMVTNNINAAVVATDGATISSGNVVVKNSQIGNTTYSETQKDFLAILDKIEKIVRDTKNQELEDALYAVQDETKKKSWNKKLITMGLNAMKGVANELVVSGLMELIEKGLEQIHLL